MATRMYNFYITSTTTGDAKANVRIAAKGNITSICFTCCGAGAAAIDTFMRFELSKQSASTFTQNDAPATVLCRFAVPGNAIASANYASNILFAGIQNPVAANDLIYIHQLLGGTAPTSCIIYCSLVVSEN